MTIDEKRELVRELSKWPESAPEKLQSWSRRDLLEILCAELGKERKYTGLTKQKMIEYLFKVVSEKKTEENEEETEDAKSNPQTPLKRKRKNDNPSRLPVASQDSLLTEGTDTDTEAVTNTRYCQNSACRAMLNQNDAFCKRCSCCICHKYDDNKDPSLWLFCSSDAPYEGDSCGLSCHLECALKHPGTGIAKSRLCRKLDGSFYCLHCGKENDLLGCWKKQLMVAKDARRVDVLCYRISLSHKLLKFTEKYRSLHEIVDTAMKKLEAEVGPITNMPNMARGIVNRLSVGAEVQRMCVRAVESLEAMLSNASSDDPEIPSHNSVPSNLIKFEDLLSTSVTVMSSLEDFTTFSQDLVGLNVWHRRAEIPDYPSEPTCAILKQKKRFVIKDLAPATEYMFKVVAFSDSKELSTWEVRIKTESPLKDNTMVLAQGEAIIKPYCGSSKTNSSGLSNPVSDGDESNNNTATYTDLNKLPDNYSEYSENPENHLTEKISDHHGENNFSQNAQMGGVSGIESVAEEQQTPGPSGSALDEEPNSMIETGVQKDSTNSVEHKSENDAPNGNDLMIVPRGHFDPTLPATPHRLENGKEACGRSPKSNPGSDLLENGLTKPEKEPGSSSKKRKCEEMCNKDGSFEGAYEYCVKVVRWLECEGHIETSFRVKFLTWFSLRASPQERRVVSVYVDTLIDDPASLAGQLVDSFSEAISSKRPQTAPTGFCMKLWH
ncbi:VIN3-like protein 3 isoform X2 [Ananas comosus]|nr:VIN3-like protein 3 isoform X2 [Ananas comosus]